LESDCEERKKSSLTEKVVMEWMKTSLAQVATSLLHCSLTTSDIGQKRTYRFRICRHRYDPVHDEHRKKNTSFIVSTRLSSLWKLRTHYGHGPKLGPAVRCFCCATRIRCSFFNAATARFFVGLTLALGCWICLGLIFGTESERTSAIVIVPVVLVMALGVGPVGFFAGRLTGRIVKAIKTRHAAG
jgi:hypothetical protein